MKKYLSLIVFFIPFVLMAQEETPKSPQIGIKVEKGQTVSFGDISVKFIQVLEDSRCPKYVNCMWAGQARVEVLVSEKGKEATTQEITLGASKATSKNTAFYTKGDYFIEAIVLNPYPEDGKEKEPYTLLINEGNN